MRVKISGVNFKFSTLSPELVSLTLNMKEIPDKAIGASPATSLIAASPEQAPVLSDWSVIAKSTRPQLKAFTPNWSLSAT